MVTVPLHATSPAESAAVVVLSTVATLGSAVLLGLAFAAFLRRRSRPYLLLVAAFVVLLARSGALLTSGFGLLSPATHHVVEHGFDAVLVALVVAAVYYARTVEREVSAS
jgi:hypothetical protein